MEQPFEAATPAFLPASESHYPGEWKETRIITARELMETVADTQRGDPA